MSRPHRARERAEAGAGTVLAVALTGVLVLVAVAVAGVGAVVATHRTAQSAADLAALAGAAAVQDGRDACGRAAGIARGNGARVRSCRVSGWEVEVVVVATSPRMLGRTWELPARSRAGPVRAAGGGSG